MKINGKTIVMYNTGYSLFALPGLFSGAFSNNIGQIPWSLQASSPLNE